MVDTPALVANDTEIPPFAVVTDPAIAVVDDVVVAAGPPPPPQPARTKPIINSRYHCPKNVRIAFRFILLSIKLIFAAMNTQTSVPLPSQVLFLYANFLPQSF